jgi:hypothetical protein
VRRITSFPSNVITGGKIPSENMYAYIRLFQKPSNPNEIKVNKFLKSILGVPRNQLQLRIINQKLAIEVSFFVRK